ncbi:MAG: TolC family protein [Deltaproteobacteria bacterium]|nr:TolC family protein [Deltaproteobacteria bacterium]
MTGRLTLALVLLAAAPAFAQPAPKSADDMAAFEKDLDALFTKGGLTADGAAARAAKASPAVRRKAAEIDAALAQLETAKLAQVPQLGGKASYTRLSFVQPFVIPFMGQSFTIPSLQNQYVLQGQVAVPLSDYVVRFPKLVDTAKLGEEAARVGEKSAEVGAGEDARLAYYEWVRTKLQVLIARRQLAQVQATLQQEQALADVQRISRADLLRVQSQEAEAEQTVDQLQNLSQLREEQLRLLIGASEAEPLAVGEDIRTDLATPQQGNLDDLLKQATSKRLEIKGLDLGIEAKEAQQKTEEANLYPRLSAFASADYDRPNQRVFPQKDEFRFTWAAGVQLTWQINDYLISRATQKRIHAERGELIADRENLVRGTRIEILAAGQAVQIALHSLQTTQKGLTAAEEGYRVRRELLNAERATAVELVDAQTDLTRARIAALNARVDLRVALTQLAHALGDDTATAK